MSLLGKFDWAAYLRECGAQAAPASAFRQSSEVLHNEFAIGMKVEARDPRNSTAMCIATVVDKVGPRIALRLDGTDDRNDFWRLVDSSDICSIGATPSIIDGRCKQRPGMLLQPPFAFMKRERDWVRMYQAVLENRDRHAPASFFKKQPSPVLRNQFAVGMKLEAVDRKNARLICVASIGEVRNDQVLVHFDGWRGAADYWTRFDSRDLFPAGWCERVGHRLELPGPGYTGTTFKVEPLLVVCQRRPKISPLKMPSRLQRTKKPIQDVPLALRSLEDFGRTLRSSKKLHSDGEADETLGANSDCASDRGPLRRRKTSPDSDLSEVTQLNLPGQGQAPRGKRPLYPVGTTSEPKLKVRRIDTSKRHRAEWTRTKPPISEAKLPDANVAAETKIRVIHQRDVLDAHMRVNVATNSFFDSTSSANSPKSNMNLASGSKHACTNSTDANANQQRPTKTKQQASEASTNLIVNQNRSTQKTGKKSPKPQNDFNTITNRDSSKGTSTILNRKCSTDTCATQVHSMPDQKRSTDTNQNQQRAKSIVAKLYRSPGQIQSMNSSKNRGQNDVRNCLINKSDDHRLMPIQNVATDKNADQGKSETQNRSTDSNTDQTNETQNRSTVSNVDQNQIQLLLCSTDTNAGQMKSLLQNETVESTEQKQNCATDTQTDEIKNVQNSTLDDIAGENRSQNQNHSTERSSTNVGNSMDQIKNCRSQSGSLADTIIDGISIRSSDDSTDQSLSCTADCLINTTAGDQIHAESQSSGDYSKKHHVTNRSTNCSSSVRVKSKDASASQSQSQSQSRSHSTDANTNPNRLSKDASASSNRYHGTIVSNSLKANVKELPSASPSSLSNASTVQNHSIDASPNRNRFKDSNPSHSTLREPFSNASTSATTTNNNVSKIEQSSVHNVAPVGPVRRANTFSFSIDSLLKRPESTPPRTVAQAPIWFPHPSNFIVPSMFVAPPHVFVQQRVYRSQPANFSTPAATSLHTNASSRLPACVECRRLLGIPLCGWSVENVTHYLWHCDVCSSCFVDVDAFVRHEIDGEALALLDGELLVRYLGMQPGPAAATMRLIDDLKAKLKRFSSSSRSKIAADA